MEKRGLGEKERMTSQKKKKKCGRSTGTLTSVPFLRGLKPEVKGQ